MSLEWVVKLKNGSTLKQSEGAQFQRDVVPRAPEVQALYLPGEGKRYGVNLETGDFLFNTGYLANLGACSGVHPDLEYSFEELRRHPDFRLSDIRPIFFRRITKTFDLATRQLLSEICVYGIGWQGTVQIPRLKKGAKQWHTERHNVKRILYVYEDGRVVLT